MQRRVPPAQASPDVPHPEHKPKPSRFEHRLDLYITAFIAVTGFAAAWSGYEASKWAGVQALRYGQASVLRVESTKAATLAGQQRLSDLLDFKTWIGAYATGNTKLEQFERERFRPEFRHAFEIWMASRPLHNENAARNPLEMPDYRSALADSANRLEALAGTRSREGQIANQRSDEYVFSAVLLASVLSLTLIAQRTTRLGARAVLIAVAGGVCLIALYRLATTPLA
jgi:hypothetical protein